MADSGCTAVSHPRLPIEHQPRPPATRSDFEIAIICALTLEADAVDALFDRHWDDDGPPYDKATGDPNAYSTGAIGRHNVVLAHMSGMGKANAAAVAANCRASFPNIKLAVIVGVCGAVPFDSQSCEIVLGDVIVSDGVVQYDLGRRLPERFMRKDTLQDLLSKPNAEIRSLLAMLRGRRRRKILQDKIARYMDVLQAEPDLGAKYPGVAYDRLFEATYRHVADGKSCDECGCAGSLVSRSRLVQDSLTPAVHFGLIASGDTVMKSGEERDDIARQEDVIGFEMEGAGVWDTFPCVVIKGACDYADSHKSKAWQRYAAATAAACTKAFLDHWVPSSSPQPGLNRPIETVQSDTKRDALLRELGWKDPTVDMERIEKTKGGLYESSSRWILTHPNYNEWRHGDTRLLWIKGGAGKGKTMLLAGITKDLRSQTKLDDPGADSFLSLFFCQKTDNSLNNAVCILKGLIYLLLIQDSSLVSYLKSDYDRMGKEIFDTSDNNVNAFYVLSRVFKQMIQHLKSETVYLAVDALDECEDGLPGLLDLIRETLENDRLKWIVTSRNQVNVDDGLALSLEVNSEAVKQAIKVYIEYKVSQIPSLKSKPTQRANVRKSLLEKADGTFLWVDLTLRSIHGALGDDVVRRIDKIPAGLTPLYERMLEDTGQPGDYRHECLIVLSIAALTKRPLHIRELQTLADLQGYDETDLENIVDMCGSFLILLESYVYSIHQSARDYLVSKAAIDKIFPSGTYAVHGRIVEKSVAAMRATLKRDMYELQHPGTRIHDVRSPSEDPLSGVGYSCVYWIDHLCETGSYLQNHGRSRLNTCDAVEPFLREHFLHWLEALSLLDVVSNGALSIMRLRNSSPIITGDTFVDLIEDAYRFILRNRWVIEQAPLQTYVSALLFTPVNSTIRRLFKEEEPSWVLVKPNAEEDWSPCLQTLEGHSGLVTSVAFSPDSSRIASGSVDKTVRVWDANSGKEICTLKGHSDLVTSVAFSPDSSRIASGSEDKTVRVWDANSGKEICTLKGHSNSVTSVAFSPDSSRIASGSEDETVRVWDANSGKEICTLKGHSNSVTSVAFSPDSSRIASGSEDKTVRVWDANSGKEICMLEGHSNWVTSVAFSPDSSRIASGSADKTVRVWDANSGKEICTLEGHSHPVTSVAFSPDSSRIASGSHDETVRVWDANSGKEICTLEGHSSSVISGSFSDDTQRVVGPHAEMPADQQLLSAGITPGWGISGNRSWITWCGRGTIWLPPDFRPGVSDISKDRSAIVIGRTTGRVVVSKMSLDLPFS